STPTVTSSYPPFFFLFFRVLRPPGGDSNFSLGADDNTNPQRKNKMASSIFGRRSVLNGKKRSGGGGVSLGERSGLPERERGECSCGKKKKKKNIQGL
uniref:Uncharacterized protein n=1 Tax=Nothobranchius furzeri TaxID=105023 RepID=A0A8C6LN89_NOTFU